ncbi:hypothetical protein CEXT_758601 [Caerostris extrusa]|uniref:Uncharacterized protein n=1 Tax=Caerostris extrusa TaxID=172846 RepID=A0AAV4Q119_CAEEX|nr:hypothetical protein CEXT_758601 [Caerostris extrusa]
MTSAVKNGIDRIKKNTTSGVGGGTNTSSLTSLPHLAPLQLLPQLSERACRHLPGPEGSAHLRACRRGGGGTV